MRGVRRVFTLRLETHFAAELDRVRPVDDGHVVLRVPVRVLNVEELAGTERGLSGDVDDGREAGIVLGEQFAVRDVRVLAGVTPDEVGRDLVAGEGEVRLVDDVRAEAAGQVHGQNLAGDDGVGGRQIRERRAEEEAALLARLAEVARVASGDAVRVAEIVVNTHRLLTRVLDVGRSRRETVGGASGRGRADVRFGEKIQERERDRVEPRRGDDVAGELRAGQRVDDGQVARLREVALTFEQTRHGDDALRGGADDAAELLREEEESLLARGVINAGDEDRAAHEITEVVIAQPGARRAFVADAPRTVDHRRVVRAESPVGVVEEAVGVEIVVAQKFVDRAVKLAPAAARDEIHDAAARTPELGGRHGRDDAKLLNRIHRGHGEQRDVRADIRVGDAVHEKVDRVAARAVNGEVDRVRQPDADLGIARTRDAGNERQELHEVAVIEREFDDAAILDHVAHGRRRLNQRRFARHRDRLGDGSGFKFDVDGLLVINAHFQIFAQVLFEALHLHGEIVGAGLDERERVKTFGVGLRPARFAGVFIGQRHLRVGDNMPRRRP